MEDAPHIQPMGDSAFVVRFGDIISLELHARVVGALRALDAARQSWVVDPRLFSPRLPTPRMAVPAGSVGIGGQQTGIYPVKCPGGWRLLGRTPMKIFSIEADPPFALNVGDRVRFVPITEAQYFSLGGKAA